MCLSLDSLAIPTSWCASLIVAGTDLAASSSCTQGLLPVQAEFQGCLCF